MLDLSKDKSKHLIEVNGKPFLAYLFDSLLRAGYRELILVIGYREDLMRKFTEDYKKSSFAKKFKNFKVTLVNQYDIMGPKEKIYGTICPLMCVEKITGKDSFLFLFGDGLFSPGDFKAMNIKDNYSYVAGLYSNQPEKYSVLFCDKKGFLIKKVEKPEKFIGNFIDPGLYKFTSEIFRQIYKVKKSPRGEYELSDALNLLAKEKKVKVKEIKDYWIDFGKPEDIKKLSKFLNENNSGK